jgi:hypothetical protein
MAAGGNGGGRPADGRGVGFMALAAAGAGGGGGRAERGGGLNGTTDLPACWLTAGAQRRWKARPAEAGERRRCVGRRACWRAVVGRRFGLRGAEGPRGRCWPVRAPLLTLGAVLHAAPHRSAGQLRLSGQGLQHRCRGSRGGAMRAAAGDPACDGVVGGARGSPGWISGRGGGGAIRVAGESFSTHGAVRRSGGWRATGSLRPGEKGEREGRRGARLVPRQGRRKKIGAQGRQWAKSGSAGKKECCSQRMRTRWWTPLPSQWTWSCAVPRSVGCWLVKKKAAGSTLLRQLYEQLAPRLPMGALGWQVADSTSTGCRAPPAAVCACRRECSSHRPVTLRGLAGGWHEAEGGGLGYRWQ